jgi:hypothetical protein
VLSQRFAARWINLVSPRPSQDHAQSHTNPTKQIAGTVRNRSSPCTPTVMYFSSNVAAGQPGQRTTQQVVRQPCCSNMHSHNAEKAQTLSSDGHRWAYGSNSTAFSNTLHHSTPPSPSHTTPLTQALRWTLCAQVRHNPGHTNQDCCCCQGAARAQDTPWKVRVSPEMLGGQPPATPSTDLLLISTEEPMGARTTW